MYCNRIRNFVEIFIVGRAPGLSMLSSGDSFFYQWRFLLFIGRIEYVVAFLYTLHMLINCQMGFWFSGPRCRIRWNKSSKVEGKLPGEHHPHHRNKLNLIKNIIHYQLVSYSHNLTRPEFWDIQSLNGVMSHHEIPRGHEMATLIIKASLWKLRSSSTTERYIYLLYFWMIGKLWTWTYLRHHKAISQIAL